MIETIQNKLKENLISKQEKKERKYLYASDIYQCQRKIWYEYNGKQTKYPYDTLRIFDNGNAVHERISKEMKETGCLQGTEVDTPQLPIVEVHGRLDLKLRINNEQVIGEIKSINLDEVTTPKREHKAQLMYYMHVTRIHKGILIYESKRNQKLFIFKVDYDEEKAQKVIDWFIETDKKMKMKRKPKKLHKEYYPCKYGSKGYCPFYEECHGIQN